MASVEKPEEALFDAARKLTDPKDRTRRYETANRLANDIQRHLNNEPVEARPPSQLYRLQKLARRNKVAFTAAAAVATTLVLGIMVSTWQAIRATRAEREQTASGKRRKRMSRRRSKLKQVKRGNATPLRKRAGTKLSYAGRLKPMNWLPGREPTLRT